MSRPERPEPKSADMGGPSSELLSKVEELVSNVDLLDIRPCSIEATLDEGVTPRTSVDLLEVDHEISFAVAEGAYASRYDYEFRLSSGPKTQAIGTIRFSLVLDYRVAEGFSPDSDAADFVASTTGFFAAYPYARELFESLVTRMHFDPIVLGLLRRNSLRPGTISIVPDRMATFEDGVGYSKSDNW